jgi:hypothetical protein
VVVVEGATLVTCVTGTITMLIIGILLNIAGLGLFCWALFTLAVIKVCFGSELSAKRYFRIFFLRISGQTAEARQSHGAPAPALFALEAAAERLAAQQAAEPVARQLRDGSRFVVPLQL